MIESELESAARIVAIKFKSRQFFRNYAGRCVEQETLNIFLNTVSYPLTYPAPLPERDLFSIDREASTQWLNAHPPELRDQANTFMKSVIRKTHSQFLLQLKKSIDSFQQQLACLPENERDFVIVIPPYCMTKSNAWVASIALPFFNYRLPLDVVEGDDDFLKSKFSNIKHFIFIDDISVSGNQATRFVNEMLKFGKNTHVHVIIPYMTKTASSILKEQSDRVVVHDHERLLTLKEMGLSQDNTRTLTTLNHKLPDGLSTHAALIKGLLLDYSDEIPFINANREPPYKKRDYTNTFLTALDMIPTLSKKPRLA